MEVNLNDYRDPESEPKTPDDSRSIWLFDAVCGMARCKVPDEVMLAILLDNEWKISESVYKQANGADVPEPLRYAKRQIKNAKEKVNQIIEAPKNNLGELFYCNDKGAPYCKNQRNIIKAISLFNVSFSYDCFNYREMVCGIKGYGPKVDDAVLNRLRLAIDQKFCFLPNKDLFYDVVKDQARKQTFHPVLDYIDSLKWDGVPRVEDWLIRYGGAEDNELVRAVGKITLIAAVRRLRQPGCKFDEMLILEGNQGTNKSTAIKILAKKEEWFNDNLPLNANSQMVIESFGGSWIVEAAELNGMRKGDVEKLKSFLSRQIEKARLAYGKTVTEQPRQCILIGTTNSSEYLQDSTGNRRFWPVKINRFDVCALKGDVDQIWAEATMLEAKGESIRLDKSLWQFATSEQNKREIDDPYIDVLVEHIGGLEGKIKSKDVLLLLGVKEGQRTQRDNVRMGEAMRKLGWEKTKLRFGGKSSENCYRRGDSSEIIEVIVDQDGHAYISKNASLKNEVF